MVSKGLDRGEFFFATQKLEEGHFDVSSIEISGESGDVRLEQADPIGGHGGAQAQIGDGRQPLSIRKENSDGIDSIRRELALGGPQIRRGESQSAPPMLAFNDSTLNGKVASEAGPGHLQITRSHSPSDAGATHRSSIHENGWNFHSPKAASGAHFLHEIHGSAATLAEGPSLPDDNFPERRMRIAELFDKVPGGSPRESPIKGHHKGKPESQRGQERQFVPGGGQELRRGLWPEDPRRVGVEGNGHRRAAQCCSVLESPAQYGAVPKMRAIENADG